MAWRRISEQAEVSRTALDRIRSGNSARVQALTAQKLLEVEAPHQVVPDLRPETFILAVGTTRRAQALCAMGFWQQYMADRLGLTRQGMQLILTGRSKLVKKKTADAVSDLFNELQMQNPPEGLYADNARARASRMGWPLPFEWDEDTIDDPSQKPFVAKEQQSRNRLQEYLTLKDAGMTDTAIAREFGISAPTLSQWLLRQRKKGNLPSTNVIAAAS